MVNRTLYSRGRQPSSRKRLKDGEEPDLFREVADTHSFFISLYKYLLSTYYMAGTVLGSSHI